MEESFVAATVASHGTTARFDSCYSQRPCLGISSIINGSGYYYTLTVRSTDRGSQKTRAVNLVGCHQYLDPPLYFQPLSNVLPIRRCRYPISALLSPLGKVVDAGLVGEFPACNAIGRWRVLIEETPMAHDQFNALQVYGCTQKGRCVIVGRRDQ